jgi:plastocyanin
MVSRSTTSRLAVAIAAGVSLLVPSRTIAATVSGSVMLAGGDAAAKKRDYSNAVVWLEPASGVALAAPSAEPKRVTMDQRDKTFVPHLLAVQVGTAVDFPNDDPINHNVFSNFDGQIFDVHLYSPQMSKRVVFRRPGMVRVFCNIHDTMSAVIAVLPTPYFAVTGADGRYAIDVPAGDYRLRFWHEHAQADEVAKLDRSVRVGDQALEIGETTVAVHSVNVVDHKDKYGHDYHEKPPEYIFYPGVRR